MVNWKNVVAIVFVILGLSIGYFSNRLVEARIAARAAQTALSDTEERWEKKFRGEAQVNAHTVRKLEKELDSAQQEANMNRFQVKILLSANEDWAKYGAKKEAALERVKAELAEVKSKLADKTNLENRTWYQLLMTMDDMVTRARKQPEQIKKPMDSPAYKVPAKMK